MKTIVLSILIFFIPIILYADRYIAYGNGKIKVHSDGTVLTTGGFNISEGQKVTVGDKEGKSQIFFVITKLQSARAGLRFKRRRIEIVGGAVLGIGRESKWIKL